MAFISPNENSSRLSKARSVSRAASVVVVLTGGLVLTGWVFDITALKSGFPGLVSIVAVSSSLVAAALLWMNAAALDRVDAELRASEEGYRSLIHAAPEAIVVLDADTERFVDANENAEHLYGLEKEALFAVPFTDLNPPVQADGRPSSETARAWMQTTLAGDRPVFDWIIRNAAGNDIPCEIRLTTLSTTGRKLIRGSISDVTERKQTEKALQASRAMFRELFESAPDAILMMDRAGTIVRVNVVAEQLFGYHREELFGKPIETLIPERFRGTHLRHRAGYVAAPRIRPMGGRLDLYGLHKDGREFPVEISLSPLETDEGMFITCIVHDVTERKAVQTALQAKNEEINLMTQQLWQTAKLATMGELAASIAHELNNPLAIVSLRIESLLSQIPEDDARRRSLTVIEEEVGRMGRLVANLLQFSRNHVQVSTLDIRKEIENTLELIQSHLRNHRVTTVREFAPDLPMIQADRQHLRQVFLNLFTNASDAMPQGGTLTIHVSMEQGQVLIEISDTGEGIAPEDMSQVMDPFFTTKPEGKGTGLGLAICRRIVQEHGGTLTISSDGRGKGATVRSSLPSTGRPEAAASQWIGEEQQ